MGNLCQFAVPYEYREMTFKCQHHVSNVGMLKN